MLTLFPPFAPTFFIPPCSLNQLGEGDLPGLHPSYPFVPLLKAKHMVALASTQVGECQLSGVRRMCICHFMSVYFKSLCMSSQVYPLARTWPLVSPPLALKASSQVWAIAYARYYVALLFCSAGIPIKPSSI